jgi:hypothetical protein
MTMDTSRRNLILNALVGGGLVGLRALATGLPVGFLTHPRRALAADPPACADKSRAQFLVLSTSGDGDPVNANVPGTYDFPDIVHAQDPSVAPATFALGGKMVTGAQVWSTLPQNVLDRTCFFHHATFTNSHPNEPKVLRLMGQTSRQECIPSIFAKYLAGCLGTIQTEPVSVGAGSVLTFEGRALPNVSPTGIRDVLGHVQGPLANLQNLRDQSLDEMNALLKQSGTSAQRAFVDSCALSRQETRKISDDVLGALSDITSDAADGQIAAAVALIRMNIAPVMAIKIPFGGDNHTDPDLLQKEVPQHQAGVALVAQLMTALAQYGLADRVTFAMLNVFGRTLKIQGTTGRGHWANHHAGIIVSGRTKGSVIGGLVPQNGDYSALPIDSVTGAGAQNGDIAFSDTLGAFAKTLGATLGIPSDVLDTNITRGKVVPAALVG